MEKIEAQPSQMDGNLEAPSVVRDCEFVDTDIEKGLLQADLTVESLAEKLKAAAGSTENNPEENSGSNQEKKAKSEGEIPNTDQANIEMGSKESIAEGNVNGKRKRRRRRGCRIRDENINQVAGSSNFHSTESSHREIEGRVTENEYPAKDIDISGRKDSSLLVLPHTEVSGETIIYKGKYSTEGGNILSNHNVEKTSHLPFLSTNEAECLSKDLGCCTRITPIPSITKKLIVLDVNGLLANIVMPAPKDYRANEHILGRAIFKRPFCDDFLKFCFQNFAVGVWSSRSK